MPTVDRWLLPDGIDEVLPREAVRIEPKLSGPDEILAAALARKG